MHYGGTGCNRMVRCDLHGGLAVLVLGCGGEMRGMKSLCTSLVIKCGV